MRFVILSCLNEYNIKGLKVFGRSLKTKEILTSVSKSTFHISKVLAMNFYIVNTHTFLHSLEIFILQHCINIHLLFGSRLQIRSLLVGLIRLYVAQFVAVIEVY